MDIEILLKEVSFKAVRSSGPGGQHVNKTASKVELTFKPSLSKGLSTIEKERIEDKLSHRITSQGFIVLTCGETRSQHRNKTLVIERLIALLKKATRVTKPRKKSKPSKGSIERRLQSKKEQAFKKANRRPPSLD